MGIEIEKIRDFVVFWNRITISSHHIIPFMIIWRWTLNLLYMSNCHAGCVEKIDYLYTESIFESKTEMWNKVYLHDPF